MEALNAVPGVSKHYCLVWRAAYSMGYQQAADLFFLVLSQFWLVCSARSAI